MAAIRYRMRFDFQLNVAKDDEKAIAEQILELKGQGLYSKTIRDGISLVSDLRAGNMDVLFELFPWVRAEFLEYMASVQPQKTEAEQAISEQLERIETILATTGGSQAGSRVGEPKAMRVPSVPALVFDDDDQDKLVINKAISGNAAQNFLNNAFKLVQ